MTQYAVKLLIIACALIIMTGLFQGAVCQDNSTEKERGKHESADGAFQIIARWINFLALLFILYYFLVRIMDTPGHFRKLSENITHAIQSSAESKKAAEQQISEIKDKLTNLESEIELVKNEALLATEQEKIKIVEETASEVKRIQEMSRREIEWKLKEAVKEVKLHTITTATLLSESMLKSQLGSEEQEKLIEKFIAGLGNKN